MLVIAMFILAVCCFIYAGVLAVYAGLTVSYLWVWPMMGVVSILLGSIFWYMDGHSNPETVILCKKIFVALFLIGIVVLGVLESMIICSGGKEVQSDARYMIILGAQVKGDKVSRALRYRLDTAGKYLEDNKNTKVIVSGGQGEGESITEAEAMYEYLVEWGIDPGRIIKEEQSTNTAENIQYSKKWVENPKDTVVVVTNGFHIYRALAISRKQGLENSYGLAAPTDKIMFIHYYLREALAVLKYKMTGEI